jgi:hypothetical protein
MSFKRRKTCVHRWVVLGWNDEILSTLFKSTLSWTQYLVFSEAIVMSACIGHIFENGSGGGGSFDSLVSMAGSIRVQLLYYFFNK